MYSGPAHMGANLESMGIHWQRKCCVEEESRLIARDEAALRKAWINEPVKILCYEFQMLLRSNKKTRAAKASDAILIQKIKSAFEASEKNGKLTENRARSCHLRGKRSARGHVPCVGDASPEVAVLLVHAVFVAHDHLREAFVGFNHGEVG